MRHPRVWLAILLLAVFLYITGSLTPYFIANLRLQRYVVELTHSAGIAASTPAAVRAQVVERAHQLGLPVEVKDVQVDLSGSGARISVRYLVLVNLPGYTVKLHFAPGAAQ
jgi:hypothetical protein